MENSKADLSIKPVLDKGDVVGSISLKGELGGICNITSCTTGLKANFFNHSTRKYYCFTCAMRLNQDYFNKRDAMRLYGHDLCTPA